MKTNKTDLIFNKMNKEILEIKSYYEFKEKEIFDNKFINDKQKLILHKNLKIEREMTIKETKIKYTNEAMKKGYNKTTQDISMLLDLDPGFCTRHIKKYIDFINIPSGVSDLFKSYQNFNVIQQVEVSKKKIFFNSNSLYKLINEHLFEVDKFVELKIDISKLIKDPLDTYYCKNLAEDFIDKITKENEYRTPISKDQLESIARGDTVLLRQDTLKQLVSQLLLRDKISSIRRRIKADFIDDSDVKLKQEVLLDDYIQKVHDMNDINKVIEDLSLLKIGNMTHQTQINRKAKTFQHTRYHLVLPDRSQPINLYAIKAGDIEIPEEEQIEQDTSDLKVVISIHSIYENIEKDIYNYIEKNLEKAKKNI